MARSVRRRCRAHLGLPPIWKPTPSRAYGAGPEAETAAAKVDPVAYPEGRSNGGLFREGRSPATAGQTWLIEIRCRLASTFSAIWTGSGRWRSGRRVAAGRQPFMRSTRGHIDDQLSEQIPGDAEDRFWQKAPTRGTVKTLQKSILSGFERLRRIGPFQNFHPLTMPRASPAASARAVAGGSSGAGPSSTRTMIPAAGSAGSAPLRPRVVVPATSAACPKKTRGLDDDPAQDEDRYGRPITRLRAARTEACSGEV